MELQKVVKNRIDYLDTAKGIGILMVCIGHACTNQTNVADCRLADMIRFVTLFHMALFFFINGMVYSEKYSQKPVSGIVKKVKAYYIPFVMYNLFFWAFHNVFARFHLISGELDEKDYAYEGIRAFLVSFIKTVLGFRQKFAGAMWFLECLLIISGVFIILDHFVTKWFPKRRICVLSILIIVILLINRLFNLLSIPYVPGSLSQMLYWGLNGLIFFYLGYLYKIFQWNQKLVKNKYWIVGMVFLAVCGVVTFMRPAVVSIITNQSIPIYRYGIGAIIGTVDMSGLSLIKYVFYLSVAVASIIMVLMASQFKLFKRCKILNTLGKNSLHIMCLHFFAFKAVSFIIIKIYNLPIERLAEYPVIKDVNGLWWLAYTVVGCTLPLGCVMVCKRINIKIWKGNKHVRKNFSK